MTESNNQIQKSLSFVTGKTFLFRNTMSTEPFISDLTLMVKVSITEPKMETALEGQFLP